MACLYDDSGEPLRSTGTGNFLNGWITTNCLKETV